MDTDGWIAFQIIDILTDTMTNCVDKSHDRCYDGY